MPGFGMLVTYATLLEKQKRSSDDESRVKDPEVRVRVRWIMKTLRAETKRALKTFDQNCQSLGCWSLWEEKKPKKPIHWGKQTITLNS